MTRCLLALLFAAPLAAADVTQEWKDQVARLPVVQQVEAVRDELRKRNPDFAQEGLKVTYRKGVVKEVTVNTYPVADISPVGAFKELEELAAIGRNSADGKLTSLAGLRGLRLKKLNVQSNPIKDVSPLRGMPLESLSLTGTLVTDLSPLRDLPLTVVELPVVKTSEYAALCDKQLVHFRAAGEGPDPAMMKRLFAAGKLNYYAAGNHPALASLDLFAAMPMRALILGGAPRLRSLAPLANCPTLLHLTVGESAVADLKPLAGLRLTHLTLSKCPVKDLSPLKGMASLSIVGFNGTAVGDLSPLAGLTDLASFSIEESRIKSLRPLGALPGLKALYLRRTVVLDRDLKPVAALPLETLYIDPSRPATAAVKDHKTLKNLNGQPTDLGLK